jgi:hypothetical protein
MDDIFLLNKDTNKSNNNIVELELTDILKKEGIVTSFTKDEINNIVLKLNHKYDEKIIVCKIDYKEWTKSIKIFKKRLLEKRVKQDHIEMLIDVIDNNHKLFLTRSQHPQENEEHDKTNEFKIQVQKLIEDNKDISFEDWSTKLLEKRTLLNEKVNEHFPAMQSLLDFELAVKKILNIQDITLPFMGIVFAAPSSLKTAFFKFLRKLPYSYYTDKFTARSFVSHSANVSKEKLAEIDMLPQIKGDILLTPELSALFTGKDDDVREQFGIITRLLDGEGLETNSGVHGKRGYHGEYMFTWLGAAVDIPHSVYKFLSTIGFKIYFLRLPRVNVTEDDLVGQLTSKKNFSEKMEEMEKLMMDYLVWFEICPISIGQSRRTKIEWDNDRDDKQIIIIIARLALLLAHLRGHVIVYESSERPDLLPVENKSNSSSSHNSSSGFSHRLPTIENASRAAQQLYNLARGHALSYGRNYITKDDILLTIKVVLSTSLIERVLILDLLIANNGTLTTSQIKDSLRISINTSKRTMTEFKGLELVTMEQVGDSSNSEFKITLNPKFSWFLTDEFKELREEFKPTDYQEELKKKKSDVRKNTPVQEEKNKQDQQEEKSSSQSLISNIDTDLYRGEIPDSKNLPYQKDEQVDDDDELKDLVTSTIYADMISIYKKEKNPQIKELILHNANNIKKRYPDSDIYICSDKCPYNGDKWFMLKHPCKNFYK